MARRSCEQPRFVRRAVLDRGCCRGHTAGHFLVDAAGRARHTERGATAIAEPGAPRPPLFRSAPIAPRLDARRREVVMVEPVLHLYSHLRRHVGVGRRGRRNCRIDRIRLDLARAVLGLGRSSLRPATPVARGIRRCRRSEHLRHSRIRPALAGRVPVGAGGARNRNHRWCGEPAVSSSGTGARTPGNDDRVRQFS